MSIEIQVGKPSPVEAHRNTFELIVEYMHGDADGTTYQTFYYPHPALTGQLESDMIGVVAALGEDRDEVVEAIRTAYQEAGVDNAELEAERIGDQLYEGDITCDGERATLVDSELFFYNEDGVKHDVTVLVDGTPVE